MLPYPTTRTSEASSPAAEPVTVAEAKAHARVDISADDALIGSLIVAAREFCERCTGRTFAQRTFVQTMRYFPEYGADIVVQRSPLISVQSVNYYAADGTDTAMVVSTGYRVRTGTMPGRISLPVGLTSWPTVSSVDDAVRIAYTAGGSVPQIARQAMLMLIAHWYENREAVVVGEASGSPVAIASRALLDTLRVRDLMP
jgi:uncharacterized phiE125 gp8 family phage protein